MQQWSQVQGEVQGTMNLSIQNFPICCSQRKAAHFFCVNKMCKQNNILCADLNCPCQKDQHNDCSFTRSAVLLSKIIKKKNSISSNPDFKNLLSQTEEAYNKLIDIISEGKEKLMKDIQSWGMFEEETILLEKIMDKKFDQINGRLVSNVIANIDIPSNKLIKKPKDLKIDSFIEETRKKLKAFMKDFQLQFTSKCTRINSEIIQTEGLYKKLTSMFKSQIVSMQLLYRATENNFSAQQFHNKCDDIRDTIVLVKTQGDQIVGGFSPQCWDQSDRYKHNSKTFIFSLTNGIKYPSVSMKKTTYCYPDQGPCFGGKTLVEKGKQQDRDDLYIPDGNSQAEFYIGSAFNDGKISNYNCNEKRIMFCGSKTQTPVVKMKQWQVFKVHLVQRDTRFRDSQSQSEESDQMIQDIDRQVSQKSSQIHQELPIRREFSAARGGYKLRR